MKQYSLRQRITLICVVPLLIFGIIIGILYRFYRQSNIDQNKNLTISLAKTYSELVDDNLNDIHTTALNASSISDVQNYLLTMTNLQKLNAYPVLTFSLNLLARSTVGCRCIFVRSENLSLLRSTSDFFVYYSALMNDYGMWSSSPPSASFFAGPYHAPGDIDSLCYVYTRMAEYDLRVKASESAFDIVTIILINPMSLLRSGTDDPSTIEGLIFNGQLISSSGELPEDLASRISGQANDEIIAVTYQGEEYYLSRMALHDHPDFDYFCLIRIGDVADSMSDIHMFIFAVLIGSVLLVLVLLFLTRQWVANPITLLVESLKAVTPETTYVARTNLTEFNDVVTAIRSMLENLRESRGRALDAQRNAYEAELSRMSAEMKSYRAQINPHFLFNTLGCISAMARDCEAQSIEKSCMALAEMCRYAMKSPLFVTLEQDIANASNYMQIMAVRMPGKYDWRVHVDSEASKIPVLSLTLQPLVENCIEHGFKDCRKKASCVIDLLALVKDETLRIRLTDNGNGMIEEAVRDVCENMIADLSYQNEHIGLNNLWHRLRLAYGDQCRMYFRSRKGFYTQVNIEIPLTPAASAPFSGDSSRVTH